MGEVKHVLFWGAIDNLNLCVLFVPPEWYMYALAGDSRSD